ncbi:hypothetical protein IM774_09465 [Erysipelotrichaceae bacterium RD49]|nr:hypothetical protein [Erysipelotrichaceae bacterium RD49]
MPLLNKIRLTHIEYNYGRTVIPDQEIDIDGISTLLKMENGGGKSVMTQMLLAPYISGRLRNFPKRAFADYFKDSKPSFIVQEWIKDGGAGLFCIGLMINRRQAVDADSQEKINIYAWISEYSGSEPFALSNLELLDETEDGRRRYKSFQASKMMMEGFVKDYPSRFALYNLSNSSHNRVFQNRLVELGIDPGEWRQMRDFNLEESGVSKFCETFDTEEKLLRRVLIPAAAAKLDKEAGLDDHASHLQHFISMTTEFVDLQAKNKDNLKAMGELQEFQTLLSDFYTRSFSLAGEYQDLNETGHKLEAFSTGIHNALDAFKREGETLDGLIRQAQADLDHLEYEGLSKKWYANKDEYDATSGELDLVEEDLEAKQTELADLEAMAGKLDCARQNEQVEETEATYLEYKEKAESAKLSNDQVEQKRSGYGSRLYQLYHDLLQQTESDLKDVQAQIKDLKQNEQAARKKQTDLNKQNQKLTSQAAIAQSRVDDFFKKETAFLEKHGLSLTHSLSWVNDKQLYDHLASRLETDLNKTSQQLNTLSANLEAKQTQKQSLETDLHQNDIDQIQTKNKQSLNTSALEAAQKALETRKTLGVQLGVELSKIWESDLFNYKYQAMITRFEAHEDQAMADIAACKRTLENLQTGTSLELSSEMNQVLEELGIEKTTGAMWLRESTMAPKKKEKLIRDFPFFPYALIMDDNLSKQVLEEFQKRNLYTSEPIFFCSRELLSQTPDPAPVLNSMSAYLHFNTNLIFPSKLKELIASLQEEQKGHEVYLASFRKSQKDLEALWKQVENEGLTEDKLNLLTKEKADLETALNTLVQKHTDLNLQIEQCSKAIADLKKQCDSTKKDVDQKTALLQGWQAICKAFDQALADQKQYDALQTTIRELKKELSRIETKLSSISSQTLEITRQCDRLASQVDENRSQVDYFEQFKEAEPAKGELEELLPRFDSLSLELSSSQYGVYVKERDRARKNLRTYRSRLESLQKQYGFVEDDWKSVIYSTHAEEQNRLERNDIRQAVQTLQAEKLELSQTVAKLEGQRESLEDQMNERFHKTKPLPQSECHEGDLHPYIQKARDDQAALVKDKEALTTKTDHFKQVYGSANAEANSLLELTRFVPMKTNEDGDVLRQAPVDVKDWTSDELDNQLSKLVTTGRHQQKTATHFLNDFSRQLSKAKEEYRTRLALCFQMLEAIEPLLANPATMPSEIEQKQALLQTFIDKTEADLKLLKDNRSALTQTLLDYISHLHTNLKAIDQDTTIQVGRGQRKMLTIELKEWDDIEAVAKARLEEYLDALIAAIDQNPDKKSALIDQRIQAAALYDALVGISGIPIRLYKIEENNQIKIAWNEAGKLSGAEGFLCAFVVISAVLNFQRKDAVSKVYGKKSWHLLLLDNPFAYVQSGHIIQALMNLCQSTATQLVAFSNVGNAEVINAFKNIYTLRLIPNYDDKNHLGVTHTKAPEAVAMDTIQIRAYDQDDEAQLLEDTFES